MTVRADDKPQHILDAASRLLIERGHASVTIGEIAQEAGVSRGLLHYYFVSKEDILAKVVRRNVESSIKETRELLREARSPEELMGRFMRVYRDALGTGSGYALYYEAFVQGRLHPLVGDELAELYQARRGSLARVLEAANRDGVIRLQGDAEAVASLVLAIGDGVALQYLSDPTMPIEEAGRLVMPLVAGLLGTDDG